MNRLRTAAVLTVVLASTGLADRALDRAEIMALFEARIAAGRLTWVESGVIRARHWEYHAATQPDAEKVEQAVQQAVLEHRSGVSSTSFLGANLRKQLLDALPFNTRYRLSNESAMASDVLLKYDGQRFFWQIDLESRYDSLELPPALTGNSMVRRFDAATNACRTCVWDGQEYTTFTGQGGSAIVDAAGNLPRVVAGPLTAGIIPWGSGLLSLADLEAAKSSGVERLDGAQRQWHLAITASTGARIEVILLPDKDYVPSYWRLAPVAEAVQTARCSQHFQAAGQWIAGSIVIEEHAWDTGRLLTHDTWELYEVQTPDLTPADFEAPLPPDTLVEYLTSVADRPLRYRTSATVDTSRLCMERLVLLANRADQPWNCATLALRYAAARLERQLEQRDCAGLLHADATPTSLLEIKQCAMDLGLYARAVRADVRTLGAMTDCQAILHFPGQGHFVLLDAVADGKAWILDMAGDRFYYNIETTFLGMDWPDGTALLLSDRPISLPSEVVELDDAAAAGFLGGEEAYACTKVRQTAYSIPCEQGGSSCSGYFEYYFERCGCEPAQTGSCTMTLLPRYMESPCVKDRWSSGDCVPSGPWTYIYMLSCEGYCTDHEY